MSLSDPISDMLTRIRNAARAGLREVEVPHSRLKEEIARILASEGYLISFETLEDGAKKTLRLHLRYKRERPVIRGLRRISKPGIRRYVQAADVPRVVGGTGIAVLSTSRGILTDREARRARVGGEVLCYIW
ncbi:MAG: 30S ribosomal protein S8 [Kiritimatiellae bacterium]|nr:30S ribosomal protein S8 [Kiritimatiellia bacterium]MDW8457497.1 30S ribosomal protein S8 [Verrucomicrobiota bacterium]